MLLIQGTFLLRRRWLIAIIFALIFVYAGKGVALAASGSIFPPGVKVNLPALIFGDEFGHSVAIDGDTLVASAWRTDVGNTKQQGVVYVFERDSHDPMLFTLSKTLTASDGHEFHEFGSAVAIDGDTIVVGVSQDSDNGHFQAGAVYVFERNHGGANAWGEVKKLVDTHFDDQFSEHGYMGDAVAIHGDTIIAGAPKKRGKVFVFERNKDGNEQWGLSQEIEAPTFAEGGNFGTALLFDGNRLVVGVSQSSMVAGHFNDEGAVFVYVHDNTGWVQQAKLFVADSDFHTDYGNNSHFGQALAMAGDLIYVGAPSMQIDGLFLAGEVYVFQHGSGNQWTHIGTITPDNIAFGDYFGSSLYAAGNGVFIASYKGINGTVHFYKQGGNAGANQALAAGALLSWTQAYTFTTDDGGGNSRFGQPIVGSGNTFVAAASGYNASQGSAFTYPLDQLLAFSTIAPSAKGLAYLPLVSSIHVQIPIESISGKLSNNQILNGPGDFKIGAVANAVTKTVDLSIATIATPDEPLPNGITAQSTNFLLRSDENLLLDPDSPFIVSLPVPQGADTAHLALAYLQPAGEAFDSVASGAAWIYLPGSYDAEHSLFLAKVPFLKADGANLLLVNNPDMDSPLNAPALQSASSSLHPFSAFCYEASFPNPGDCTPAMQTEVQEYMDEVWAGMVTQYHFPAKIRLLDSGSTFLVSEAYSVTNLAATYAVNIVYKDNILCKGFNGSYNPETGFLLICLDKNQSLDHDKKQTAIHELFHAIQFTYQKVMTDREHGSEQDWIIEGMATSAMLSFSVGTMARTPYYGFDNLHKVDMAITQGTANDIPLDEYLAQDFWVYLGQVQNKDLGYLGPLLSNGGATVEGMVNALAFLGNGPDDFAGRYWGWVKNQAIEHTHDLGGGPGQTCQLADEAMTGGLHHLFSSSAQHYPLTDDWEPLQPLTAQVVEILVPHTDNAIIVAVKYQECDGISDPTQQRACYEKQQEVVHAKIYAEGEANCELQTLPGADPIFEGQRTLSPIVVGTRYFVVVANSDLHQEHEFAIDIE